MRKGKGNRKSLKGVYSCFSSKGLNQDRFINSLKKNGVILYDIKKESEKSLTFKVNGKDDEKVFAINKDVWYNAYEIKKTGERGLLYPLLYLMRNCGVIAGGLLFIAFCICFNNVICGFYFTGTGSIYKRELVEYLNGKGITVYSRFSDVDLEKLEDDILADNEFLSFVGCYKKGNRLVIDCNLSKKSPKSLTGNAKELVCDVDGEIETIKVYRGTAKVNVGDKVSCGDVLVAGFAEIKEQTVEVNVIACATVLYKKEFVYYSKNSGQEENALLFAKEKAGDLEETDCVVICEEENGEYTYRVIMTVRRVLFAG